MQTRSNITTRSEPHYQRNIEGPHSRMHAELVRNNHCGKCRQDFRSEFLLVDARKGLEEEIHLVMNEHSIVQTDENLNYTMTETRGEHRSSTFASSKQI